MSIATVVGNWPCPKQTTGPDDDLGELFQGLSMLVLAALLGRGILPVGFLLEELGGVPSKVPHAASIFDFCFFLPPISWDILYIGLVRI